MITYLYQIKSDNKKVPYVLSWISFLGAIVGFACQAIFVVQRITAGDTALNVFYYCMSALGVFTVIFVSAVYHRASQKSIGEFYGV
jgi:predicted membrane channel-forming protein YqfA (hemolysin III family)